ncbi:hypothetical protein [Mesorhizobium sp. B2-3-13]|uniref:hypothetical protein n=1 Tax=Mesorhizobium sp. B2-3-13 TaxID=2589951 RepID=UPI001FEEFA09|nr:hypothetical protein [Mesorhizobium sp. B2-3-13]
MFIWVDPFPVPGIWLGVAKLPIHFLTRIIMFTSQCNTGVNESTFKMPDTIENASKPRASQHGTWNLELGHGVDELGMARPVEGEPCNGFACKRGGDRPIRAIGARATGDAAGERADQSIEKD